MVLLSFRGDAHKLYIKVKKAIKQNRSVQDIKEIREITTIESYYSRLSTEDLNYVKYRVIKEKNGSGILPLLVSSLPWLLFIFSEKLQTWLFKNNFLWVFIFVYVSTMIACVVIHFREKAWANVHLAMIEDLLKDK